MDEIHFAPPKEPWLKPYRLLECAGESSWFLKGGATWMSMHPQYQEDFIASEALLDRQLPFLSHALYPKNQHQ